MNQETRRQLAVARAERQTRAAAPFAKQAARIFHAESLNVLDAAAMSQAEALAAVADEPWERWFEQIWLGYAVEESWARTLASIVGTKADPPQLPANVWRRLREFIRQRQQSVTDRTKSDLLELFEQGLPTTELLDNIRRLYNQFELTRAERMAVQEVLTSAETVQHEAALTASSTVEKVWATVGDSHVRDTHAEADSQRRPIEDPFFVGGYPLDHPRDPAGPIQETISCRCSSFYETVEPRRR